MISVKEKENNAADLHLEGDLTICAADKFYQEMESLLKTYRRLDIDMSDVSEFDTSCYQVLLRAKLMSMKSNKELNIGSLSDQTQQVFDMYNLNQVFNHSDQKNSH